MRLRIENHLFSVPLYIFHLTIFSILGMFSLYWLLVITRNSYGADYGIYFNAYADARSGINPYLPYAVGSKFVSHPIVLVIVRLLFFQNELNSKLIWSGVSAAAWVSCIYLSLKILDLDFHKKKFFESLDMRSIWFLSILIFFAPFLEMIAVGQINVFALFFIVASFFLTEKEKPILAGLSISIAILLKTSPLIFLGYFILIREYRVVLYAIVGMVLVTLLSQILFPIPVVEQFLDILPRLSNEIHPTQFNHSLSSIAFSLLINIVSQDLNSIIPIMNKIILGLLFLIIAWINWRFPTDTLRGRMWLFSSIQVLAVLFSPLVWYHHYTFLLFPLILLLTENSNFLRILGVISITLFQLERFFEYYAISFPWPALFAMLILFITSFVVYVQSVTTNHLSTVD